MRRLTVQGKIVLIGGAALVLGLSAYGIHAFTQNSAQTTPGLVSGTPTSLPELPHLPVAAVQQPIPAVSTAPGPVAPPASVAPATAAPPAPRVTAEAAPTAVASSSFTLPAAKPATPPQITVIAPVEPPPALQPIPLQEAPVLSTVVSTEPTTSLRELIGPASTCPVDLNAMKAAATP